MNTSEPTIEGLRDWSARVVMGWIWSEEWQMWHISTEEAMCSPDELPLIQTDSDNTESFQLLWLPDYPTTGQIWLLIEKMRERGFNFNLNWQQLPQIRVAIARFHQLQPFKEGMGSNNNPCLAILRAIHDAIEKREVQT